MDLLLNNTPLNRDIIKIIVKYHDFSLEMLMKKREQGKQKDGSITEYMIKKNIIQSVSYGYDGYRQYIPSCEYFTLIPNIIKSLIYSSDLKDIVKIYEGYENIDIVLKDVKDSYKVIELGMMTYQ